MTTMIETTERMKPVSGFIAYVNGIAS